MLGPTEPAALLEWLADLACRASAGPARPARVGVEGRSAAGKTTTADRLGECIAARGRQVVRASIDDFHPPGYSGRSQRGEWTLESYLAEGYDYAGFAANVLEPLAPGRSRRVRTAVWDSYRDEPISREPETLEDDGILLVDGAFLFKPELEPHWDLVIWLDIDIELMIERARTRDVAWVGSEEVVVERYRNRWAPMHLHYEKLYQPREKADVVIDHSDFEAPVVLRGPDTR